MWTEEKGKWLVNNYAHQTQQFLEKKNTNLNLWIQTKLVTDKGVVKTIHTSLYLNVSICGKQDTV